MDTVSNSSYWNKIVVLAAQEDPGCWGTALYMLEDATQVSPADPRALYLKAQLRFNLDAPKRTTTGYIDDNFMFDEFFEPSAEDPTVNSFGDKRIDWGLPMVQCCLKDERNLKYMLNDGTFNKEYRKAFKKYWKKLKADPEQCRKILTDLEKSAAPPTSSAAGNPRRCRKWRRNYGGTGHRDRRRTHNHLVCRSGIRNGNPDQQCRQGQSACHTGTTTRRNTHGGMK